MLKVTTPIFYVNAKPHLGHAYTMILADVYSRYKKLIGESIILTTGCDEHGSKVQQAAASNNIQEHCDRMSQNFIDLAQKLGIEYGHFTRTTADAHKQQVQEMWTRMVQNGDIYKGTYTGWYSLTDEAFYTNSQVKKGDNGFMYSKDTNSKVQLVSEENYMFRLSKYKDCLLFKLRESLTITPENRKNDIQSWLMDLEDISVSRPRSKVGWAIPVPGDGEHTIYVWLDALLGYLQPTTQKMVHFVGKDILKFHALIWPAFCASLGICPPERIFAHGHWTVQGSKMSKSKGNGISPDETISHCGVESLRYGLLRTSKLSDDADYDPANLIAIHNNELVNQLGNLYARCTSPKLLAHYSPFIDGKFDDRDIKNHYENGEFYLALEKVMDVIREGNRIMNAERPWVSDNPKMTLQNMLERLSFAAKWLSPVMPRTSAILGELLEKPKPGVLLFQRHQRQSLEGAKDAKVLL